MDWAKSALDEAHTACLEFGASNPFTIREKSAGRGYKMVKATLSQSLPDIIHRRLNEAITNTRHACDQMIHATFLALRTAPPAKIFFPWATSEADLEGRMKALGLPEEVRQVLRDHKPYPTGNTTSRERDVVRQLAIMANQKHTVGIRAQINVAGLGIGQGMVQGQVTIAPRWDALKKEFHIARIGPNSTFKFEGRLAVAVLFNERALPWPIDAVGGTRLFVNFASAVLDALEAQCMKLNS